MIQVMYGKFSGVTIDNIQMPKTVMLDSVNEIPKLINNGNEVLVSEVTGRDVYDIFDYHGVSREDTMSFLKELKKEMININDFRVGYILTYRDISGYIPLHQFFKDSAFEKFYVECIEKYFN